MVSLIWPIFCFFIGFSVDARARTRDRCSSEVVANGGFFPLWQGLIFRGSVLKIRVATEVLAVITL